jgi:hypothetical protein
MATRVKALPVYLRNHISEDNSTQAVGSNDDLDFAAGFNGILVDD